MDPSSAAHPSAGKIDHNSWAVQVTLAVLRRLGQDHMVEVVEVRLLGPSDVAILFRPLGVGAPAWTGPPLGVRLTATTPIADILVGRGPDHRAGDIGPEDLAFDLANLIIGEPFGEESLGPPDGQGVRWRRLDAF